MKKPVINLSACINLFRGVLHFERGSERVANKSVVFDAEFTSHGRRVHVHKRADGVLFVNAAGRTALVTSSLNDALKREVAAALRR